MTTLFVPKELRPRERRVAAMAETVQRLVKDGFRVVVERGAGEGAGIDDAAYERAGASMAATPAEGAKGAEVVAKLHPPTEAEVSTYEPGALLVSHVWPYTNKAICERLLGQKITAFVMDQIPRTTKAQYMDALSSQMNLAGYKAVLIAAERLPKVIPLMMTAAGTINPAKVLIMGAGVAGLSAIGTAKRLGAVVHATDVRPEVKDQVTSLGAKFIEPPGSAVGEGGYAAVQSEDFAEKQRATVRKHLVAADIIITTAKIPGKKPPLLVTRDVVKEMRRGSVIVDLAAEEGGNCELTVPDQIVDKHGVTIVGIADLAATMPVDASALYAKNVLAVMKHLFAKGTQLNLDFTDAIIDGAVMFRDGVCRSERLREEHGFASSATSKSAAPPTRPSPPQA
jgi:H+-translocating NAD(P) transhydrogenase subunit alpha